MTVPTDQFADIAHRSQEAVTTAVRTWADTVQNVAATVSSARSPLPDLRGVVGQYFDFAEKVLAGQRELAQQWAAGAVKAAEADAEKAGETTQEVTQEVTEQAVSGTETVAGVADGADSAARTARGSDDSLLY